MRTVRIWTMPTGSLLFPGSQSDESKVGARSFSFSNGYMAMMICIKGLFSTKLLIYFVRS